eukprot:Gb_13155 [translate_table: standard]
MTKEQILAAAEEEEEEEVENKEEAKADDRLTEVEFVMVHGGGHGSWCWFKSLQLLRSAGHKATAIDLASDDVSITSFHRYTQPLIDYLHSTPDCARMVLVGHSLAGLSMGKAMELFPHKICAAVFVAAFMPPSGFALTDVVREAWEFGQIKPDEAEYEFDASNIPISVKFPPPILRTYFYQLCEPEDAEMGCRMVGRSPTFAGGREMTEYKEGNYGSVARAFVMTAQDKVLTDAYQRLQTTRNPPQHVYSIDSDHSPFFSAPHQLHEILTHIAHLYAPPPPTH